MYTQSRHSTWKITSSSWEIQLSLSYTQKNTHTLSLSALIKQKKTDNNGIFHRQGFVPHSNGNPLTPRPLLRRPPSLLENLRHRPRHPPQQTDRQTRYSSLSLSRFLNQKTPPFLSRIFVLTKTLRFGGVSTFYSWSRSVPDRSRSSEICRVVPRRVRLGSPWWPCRHDTSFSR